MKLVLKNDDNTEVEVKEIQTINKDCKAIILFTNVKLKMESMDLIQEYLSKVLGTKVIILDKCFETKIYSVK